MTEQEQAEAVVVGLAGFKVGDKVWAELRMIGDGKTEPLAGVIEHISQGYALYIVRFEPCQRFKYGDTMSTHERELSLRHD